MKILDANKISTLSIKVSEKIEEKNILQFLRTNILNSELEFSKDSYFYYTYLHDTLSYEILLYDKLTNDIILEPFLFINDSSNSKNDTVITKVFITDNYFVITQNNKFLLLKHISNTIKDDIVVYIKQMYKIEPFEIEYITQEELLEIKRTKSKSVPNSSFPLYSKKSFAIFLIFLLTTFSLFLFMILVSYYSYQDNTKIILPNKDIQKVVYHNRPLEKIIKLFSYIKSNKIQTTKISFSHNKIKTTLQHSNKTQLIDFMNIYKNKIQVKSLKYKSNNETFNMDVIIEF
jgi:hypothetical protein